MSRSRTIVPPLDQTGDRQAPSSLVNACKSQVPWHYMLGLISLAIGSAFAWNNYQTLRWDEAVRVLRGMPVGLDRNAILSITGIFLVLPVLTAIAFFRCGAAMGRFALTHQVHHLHPAVSRLRLVWLLLFLSCVTLFCEIPIREFLVPLFQHK